MKKNILLATLFAGLLIAPQLLFCHEVIGQLVSAGSAIRLKSVKFGPELKLNLKSVHTTTDVHGNFDVDLQPGKWVVVIRNYKPIIVTIPTELGTSAYDLTTLSVTPKP
jgi:hypothetical protein